MDKPSWSNCLKKKFLRGYWCVSIKNKNCRTKPEFLISSPPPPNLFLLKYIHKKKKLSYNRKLHRPIIQFSEESVEVLILYYSVPKYDQLLQVSSPDISKYGFWSLLAYTITESFVGLVFKTFLGVVDGLQCLQNPHQLDWLALLASITSVYFITPPPPNFRKHITPMVCNTEPSHCRIKYT